LDDDRKHSRGLAGRVDVRPVVGRPGAECPEYLMAVNGEVAEAIGMSALRHDQQVERILEAPCATAAVRGSTAPREAPAAGGRIGPLHTCAEAAE
jgi:hypothetical protein